MNRKKLDEDAIVNELKGGGSLFFRKPEPSPAATTGSERPTRDSVTALERPKSRTVDSETEGEAPKPSGVQEQKEKQNVPTNKQASIDASRLASYPDSLIDHVRKIVKTVGKEVSFVRLTVYEKNELRDIVYTYKRQGVALSENEINRIAVNFLLEDYKVNGKTSLLAKVIEALLA